MLRLRRGTAAEWAASEPQPDGEVLRLGEPGYEKDTRKLKIGNGVDGWNNLDYINGGASIDPEDIQDIIGSGFLTSGNNINIVYDDEEDSLIVNTVLDPTFDKIQLDVAADSTLTQGQIGWNNTEGTVDIALTNSVVAHVGEHQLFRIRNETGDVLYKGQLVYADTVHANGLIEPQLFVADGSIREIRFLGVVLENINNNNNGYVVSFGHIEQMDLDGSASNFAVGDETWVAGDILYAHPTVPGKLTNVSPKHDIWVAIILDVGNGNGNGRMFVRPTSYGHLDDVHDVNVSGVVDGQFLVYNSASDYWVPSEGVSWNNSNISLTDTKGIIWPSVGSEAYIIADINDGGSISIGNVDMVYINSTLDCVEVNTANGLAIQGSYLTTNAPYSPTRTWTLPDANGTVVVADESGYLVTPNGNVLTGGNVEAPFGTVLGASLLLYTGGVPTELTSAAGTSRTITFPDANGTVVLRDNGLTDAYIDQYGVLNIYGGVVAGLQSPWSDLFYIDPYGISFNTSNNFNFATFNNTNLTAGREYYLPDNDGAVVVENGPYITNPGASALTTTALKLDTGVGSIFTTLEAYPTTNRTITFPDADGTAVVFSSSFPTLSTDPGVPGQIATDGNDLYICVAADTWMKATLSTF